MYRLNENFTVNDLVNKWTHKVRHGLKYLLQRQGYIGMSVAYAGGFLKVHPNTSTPDIQNLLMMFSSEFIGDPVDPFQDVLLWLLDATRAVARSWCHRTIRPCRQSLTATIWRAPDRETMVLAPKSVEIMRQSALQRYIVEIRPGADCRSDSDFELFRIPWPHFLSPCGNLSYGA